VVLVIDHGEDGALGVVLNQPAAAGVDEILGDWAEQAALLPPAVVFSGGPVTPEAVIGLALVVPGTGPGAADEADGGPARPRTILGSVAPVDLAVPPERQPLLLAGVRLFAGYAGWSRGQLEEELAEEAWFVLEAFPADVFASDPGRLWRDVLRRQGGSLSLLAGFPPDPSVN
jgi:putative transcriptional regulator